MKKHHLKNFDDNKPIKKYVVTQFKKVDSKSIQTQKPKKKKRILITAIITLSILLIGSVTYNVIQYFAIKEAPEYIVTYDDGFPSFSEWSDANKATEKAEFLDKNIVFVIDGYGDYFYTYDEMMNVVEGKGEFSYWAYSKELAIAEGYTAAFRN